MPLTPQAAELLRDELVEKYTNESANTAKVFAAIPQAKYDYKPHPKSFSFKDLAWHTANSESWFVGSLAGKGFSMESMPSDVPKEAPATVAGLVETYQRITAARIAELKAMSGAQLARELDFMGIMTKPAIKFMGIALDHAIHHRGQLTVYLRLVDAKVPSVYGPSADENPFEKK